MLCLMATQSIPFLSFIQPRTRPTWMGMAGRFARGIGMMKKWQPSASYSSFLKTNDFEWARTGHLPAVKAVFDMPQFKALPHRDNIEKISKIGQTLPDGVMRQFALQDIVGEELAAAINGNKSVDDALARIEERVNDLLGNL